jgi:hypothetical protein
MANTKVGGNQLRLTDSHALTGSAVAPSVLVDLASAQTREGSSIAAGLFFSGSVRLSAAPTHKQDAATKVYVDSVAGGGVATNQIAWGNADGSGVESASSLWYSDGASILYASGSILSPKFTSADAMDISSTGALTIDSVGTDNVSIGHEAAAKTIQLGNAASTAVDIDALAVTVTSVNALTLTDGTADFALDGSGAASLAAATTVDLDSTGIMSLNSTAAINVGDDAVAAKISVGGDVATRTEVELNAIVVDINAGATGVTIDALDAGTVDIGTSAAVGSTTSAINIGTSATLRTITVGNAASTKVDVNALIIELDSAGTIVLDSATTTDVDSTGILSLNSAAAINIGNDDVDQAINIGIDGTRTITIGDAADSTILIKSLGGTFTLDGTGQTVDLNSAALDIDASGAVNVTTAGAASDISLVTAHTAGVAFLLDADADAGSIVQVDAGILDLNVTAAATLDAVGIALGAGSGELDLTTTGLMDLNSAAFDLDASGAVTIDAVGASNLSTVGALTVSGTAGNTYGAGSGAAASAHLFQQADTTVLSIGGGAIGIKSGASLTAEAGSQVQFQAATGLQLPSFFWLTGSATASAGGETSFEIGSNILASLSTDSDAVKVHLNGIRQLAGSGADYMLSSSLLSAQRFIKFNTAPVSGDVVLFDYSRVS